MCYNKITMSENDLEQLETKVKPIFVKNGVVRAAIFGSYARGKARKNSDIDFLVTIKNPEMGLLEFIGMKQELEKTLKRKVDIVESGALKPNLKKYVIRDLIKIL